MRKQLVALVVSRHISALACLAAGMVALLVREPTTAIGCFVAALACAMGASVAKSLSDYCDEHFQ